MKRPIRFWPLLLLLCAAGAQAQMYKWVGPDGKINYTDTPPPPSVKQVETKQTITSDREQVDLPYELAQATKGNPVTLYSAAKCAPCDAGRKLLGARGIPFTEKTVASNDDITQLRQAGGDAQLPFLVIGRNKQEGFAESTWNAALTAAGYPEVSKLPKNYRNPPPESAAPAPKPAADQPETKDTANPPRNNGEPPPPAGNAPPGFRF